MSNSNLVCRVFIATSLDGYIARKNGDIDWLEKFESSPDEDYGYGAFAGQVDGIIMGRGTFEKISGFDSWPYEIPVIVMSKTLSMEQIPGPLKDKVEILADYPIDITQTLSERGWKTAYIDGGKVIQSFLDDDLINEMIITRLPILIGEGRPLFGELGQDKILHHISTNTYPSGFVQSRYRLQPFD